ncbi:MAG: translation initiation factor 2 [Lachnospiraceae bacterium]|nr:translation initiation factor 2 [Lachnospiraceae bacterium]
MKGIHHITVSNSTVKYDFDIRRNITIIKGDSATGKTTLVELINEYYESGADSGVTLICDKTCRVIAGRDWNTVLSTITDSIVFIDEDNSFLTSYDFAEVVRESDNYYVLVTREGLVNLPYSVDEIYGIRTSGKYAGLKQSYHEFYHIYGDHKPQNAINPDTVVVEDSNSGYDFFSNISKDKSYSVVSAGGKTNVFKTVSEDAEGNVVVIADGAAFGAEMDRMMKYVSRHKNITLYLPESFEWLLLTSNLLQWGEVHKVLENPSDYIESSEYFSWERFFTHLLIEKTQNTFLQYSKKSLNDAYLQKSVVDKILTKIHDIKL